MLNQAMAKSYSQPFIIRQTSEPSFKYSTPINTSNQYTYGSTECKQTVLQSSPTNILQIPQNMGQNTNLGKVSKFSIGEHCLQQNMKVQLTHNIKSNQQGNKQLAKEKVDAIIVNIRSGGFEQNQSARQKQNNALNTLEYSVSEEALDLLIQGFQNSFKDETIKQLFKQIALIKPSCVVFNWGLTPILSTKLPIISNRLMQILFQILTKQFTVVFDSISFKALLRDWDQNVLGPNPFFTILKQFSSLKKNEKDQNSQNKYQLKIEKSSKQIIPYLIEKCKLSHNKYKLEILSVAQNKSPNNGIVGHILLTYLTQGKILINIQNWGDFFDILSKELIETSSLNSQSHSSTFTTQQTGAQVFVNRANPYRSFH